VLTAVFGLGFGGVLQAQSDAEFTAFAKGFSAQILSSWKTMSIEQQKTSLPALKVAYNDMATDSPQSALNELRPVLEVIKKIDPDYDSLKSPTRSKLDVVKVRFNDYCQETADRYYETLAQYWVQLYEQIAHCIPGKKGHQVLQRNQKRFKRLKAGEKLVNNPTYWHIVEDLDLYIGVAHAGKNHPALKTMDELQDLPSEERIKWESLPVFVALLEVAEGAEEHVYLGTYAMQAKSFTEVKAYQEEGLSIVKELDELMKTLPALVEVHSWE